MMDMNTNTDKTMKSFCEACDGSESCDTRKAMPPLPENLVDKLLRFHLEMRMLGLLTEILRHYEPEQENEEDPDDGKIAVQLYAAEAPEVLTCSEICLDYGDFMDEFNRLDDFMGEGLTLYYDPDEIESFGGKLYLTGAAVVCCRDEDGKLCSLDGEDIYHTLGWVERKRVTLSRNGEKIPALWIY